MAPRPGPSLRALLFESGGGAVLGQTASFLVSSEATLGTGGRGPHVRPSGPCCFGVASASFVRIGGWKTAQTASFLVGLENDVRHWGPRPAGPVRPSRPYCFGVAKAPFVRPGGWKTGAAGRRPGPSLRALLFWRRCRL